MARSRRDTRAGKLRIGDDWNAIRIIALSQQNPLKAVAEFVENSIDAGASRVTITRAREQGNQVLRIVDDGNGVPRDSEGLPDFQYVATHICDSIKRRLKTEGARGIQGEFGIGLLSFWTVGEALSITCAGNDGTAYTMHMRKGDPGYSVQRRRMLLPHTGTELRIAPLLSGLKQLSGDKMQWYLAAELRERIRQTGVDVDIVDRVARKQYRVEPRHFAGRLLHGLPEVSSAQGPVFVELYLSEEAPENQVALYRHGTRVVADLAALEGLDHPPWTDRVLQGVLDAPFLNLTPATRSGLVHDRQYAGLLEVLAPLEARLNDLIEEQRRAERERASRNLLRTIHKAFREALLALPAEEYDWFDIHDKATRRPGGHAGDAGMAGSAGVREPEPPEAADNEPQKRFFEYAGPLHRVQVAPSSCVLPVDRSRTLRAVCRDRSGRIVEESLAFEWRILEGDGTLDGSDREMVNYTADAEPGLVRLALRVTQRDIVREAEALITVTDSLLPESREPSAPRQGLPGYTFERAPGRLWRSRFDAGQNIIVINNGHRDYVYASKAKALKLRYIARLYAKELVLKNFPGETADELLERLIELSLYTEENLKKGGAGR